MKIISKFKDYYDYLAHIYGVDDNIVLNRNPVNKPVDYKGFSLTDPDIGDVSEFENKYIGWRTDDGRYISFLLVAGHVFALSPDRVILPESYSKGYWMRKSYFPGMFDESTFKTLKKFNRPILEIRPDGWREIKAVDKWPNLADLGIPRYIDADTMYKTLYNFIQQELTVNPDEMPETTRLTDKEKIETHGFDKRISFRHRV